MKLKIEKSGLTVRKVLHEIHVIYMIPMLLLPIINKLSGGWWILYAASVILFLNLVYNDLISPILKLTEAQVVFKPLLERDFLPFSITFTELNVENIKRYSLSEDLLEITTFSQDNYRIFLKLKDTDLEILRKSLSKILEKNLRLG